MAYEPPLPRDRWCADCRRDDDERRARREARTHLFEPANVPFFDDDGWEDGLGTLFEPDSTTT
jgi:hypothetical protein